jgi:hypothetical protein
MSIPSFYSKHDRYARHFTSVARGLRRRFTIDAIVPGPYVELANARRNQRFGRPFGRSSPSLIAKWFVLLMTNWICACAVKW